jgi:hypothetical protein
MPARKKTLEDFVRDRTFLARRHRALLASSPPLADPALHPFQERHCNEQDSLAQLQIARELERALRERPQVGPTELAALLRPLGKPGSVEQLLRFFPRFLAHRAGPMAGKPFVLEPFQERFLRQFFARDKQGERIYSVGRARSTLLFKRLSLAHPRVELELLARMPAQEVLEAEAHRVS